MLDMHEVIGSSPTISTNGKREPEKGLPFFRWRKWARTSRGAGKHASVFLRRRAKVRARKIHEILGWRRLRISVKYGETRTVFPVAARFFGARLYSARRILPFRER